MKRIILFFGIVILLAGLSREGIAQLAINKVVIDAGHGGKDPGAMGRKSREKDIALAVALKTGEYINKYLPDVEVVYTRKTDVFVELYRRAQIANNSEADLFISIHCNSTRSSQPKGAETYVMGLHKTTANLEIAKTENAAILQEENYSDMYEGFDPSQDEDYVTLSLFQNAFLDESLDIASQVQTQFHQRVGRFNRGVKQAGFWVLYKTAMPGILIELGFLSNPDEERFLMSEEGQVYMASAIYRAFRDYKKKYEENTSTAKINTDKKEDEDGRDVFYRVQFFTSKKEKELDSKKFNGIDDVRVYYHNGLYKYTAGNETSLPEAHKRKNDLINMGIKDAFIVAFYKDERISVEEAQKMLQD